jgi:predicted histone-like DNA-binding protein
MLRYKLVQRKDMSKGALEGSKLYYPQVINLGRVSFDSLCEEVAEQSSLTSGDIKNCMDRLVNCLVRHLKEGRSVDCGDLGSFRINIRSTGADTPETYDAATMMRKPSVQYYLGKKLRDMQDTGVQYERYTPPSNE